MGLLGDSWEDPRTAAILNLAGGLLSQRNLGADMSEEERRESEQVIVAAVVATGIAVQSAVASSAVVVGLTTTESL